jgi:hypothetical protein
MPSGFASSVTPDRAATCERSDPGNVTEGDLRRVGRDPPGLGATELPQARAARLHAARQQDPQPHEQGERQDEHDDRRPGAALRSLHAEGDVMGAQLGDELTAVIRRIAILIARVVGGPCPERVVARTHFDARDLALLDACENLVERILRGRWSSEGISARSSAKTARGSSHANLLDVLRRSFMPHARICYGVRRRPERRVWLRRIGRGPREARDEAYAGATRRHLAASPRHRSSARSARRPPTNR